MVRNVYLQVYEWSKVKRRTAIFHGMQCSGRQLLAFCDCEGLVHFSPVDDVPPRGEVIGAAVLVLQIVGVLPNVVAEDGVEAQAQRRGLIGRGDDLELASRGQRRAPTGAER